MKILLAYQSGLTNRKDPYISLLPNGLCSLHAYLRNAGHDSILANFSAWQTDHITRELFQLKPDFIGISQWTHNRHSSIQLAQLCRNTLPESIIVMGGGHASFCYEDILTETSPVDVITIGEAEATMLELLAMPEREKWQKISGLAFRQNNRIIVTNIRKPFDRLDELASASKYFDFSLGLDIDLQAEFIVTSRGCPSTCNFCSSPQFWGKTVRFKSPEIIVEEILAIREKYGLIYFSIRDDTFTADRRRTIQFCRLLQEKSANILWNCQSRVSAIDKEVIAEMKLAGCECIQLGIESGSPEILELLGKKITVQQIIDASSLIQNSGINLSIYLISDIPKETDIDIQKTIKLIRKISPNDGYVSPLAYYPGTKLYMNAVSEGIIPKSVFADSKNSAVYAVSQKGKSFALTFREISKIAHKKRAKAPDSAKNDLSFNYVSNVIDGEYFRQNGNYEVAEKEFRKITIEDKKNPWGWFLLAELYAEIDNKIAANACYSEVLKIIPKHQPSIKGFKSTGLKKRDHLNDLAFLTAKT